MTLLIERSTQVFASGFTGTSSPVKGNGGATQKIAVLIAVGATPTITFAIQGSPDGQNWATISVLKDGAANAGYPPSIITDTETVAAVYFYAIANPWFPYLRLNVTANTNITINGFWLLESDIALPRSWAQDLSPAQI